MNPAKKLQIFKRRNERPPFEAEADETWQSGAHPGMIWLCQDILSDL